MKPRLVVGRTKVGVKQELDTGSRICGLYVVKYDSDEGVVVVNVKLGIISGQVHSAH